MAKDVAIEKAAMEKAMAEEQMKKIHYEQMMLQEEHAMLAAKCADMEAQVNMIAKKRKAMDAAIMELNAVLNELQECKQAMKSSVETDAAAKQP